MSENGQTPADGQKSSNKGLKVAIIVIVILLVIAIAVILFILLRPKEAPESIDARGTLVTKNNVDEITINTEPIEDGYFETSMTINWHFDGTESEDAYVANVAENTRTVYFDLNLADTGETIYSSPYIPVGSEMSGLVLDKKLEPGTYETIMVYHLVDDDHNEKSKVSVALTIYVE